MNQLSNQLSEQDESSQASNTSIENQNIINISQNSDREEINIEDQCFNSINFQVRKGQKDSSIDLESIQNEDTDQQKLIEILQNQQYFELNKQNLKQQLYSVNCFIPEDELENDFSSSEKLEQDIKKQNKSIISELTQISLNEVAQGNSKNTDIHDDDKKNQEGDQSQNQQNAEVQKEIECYQLSEEQVQKQDLLNEIKYLLDNNDYAGNKQQIEKMTRLLVEIPYFQQILTSDGYKKEEILSVCQILQGQNVQQNNFLFHINDPSDYLYILLDGYMAVYVPKSDHDVQQEIDINYNIVLNEKLLNKMQATNHMHQAKQEAKNKLEMLYKQRQLYFNKNHEDFLKQSSNNSQKYFNQEQQKCRFRRARVLKPGDVFGHTALAIKKNRTASVIAMNNCVLAKIHGSLYSKYFKREYEKREFLLKCMRLFLQFPQKNVDRIESSPFLFKEVSFKRNEIIYKRNDDKASKFYFVYKGGVEMIKQVTGYDILNFSNRLEKQMQNKVRKYTQTKDLCVLNINPGDFFGHEDIFDQQKRQLTAQSSSSETILFEIELQLLNELDSPLILQNVKQLGEQRKQRCLEKLQEIQSFKQENLRQKPVQSQLPQDVQRIIKEQIVQKSLNYQLKIEQDKRTQLENQEHLQLKDQKLSLEIDPSKNKRMILGDDSDYQRAKQKIQKMLEGQLGKQEQAETYYQKISRPMQINNFENCLNYIQTVPSFSKLKSNQFLPSLKESIHIFEEEKLKKKIQQSQMTRKMSIEDHSQSKSIKFRCNSSNLIPSNNHAEQDQLGLNPNSYDQSQISSFHNKAKNGEINYKVLTPLHIKSSYQLNLEAELIDQSKKKAANIEYSTPKSLFSNQNLSPKLNLQDEAQEKLVIRSSFNFQTERVQEQQDSNQQVNQNLTGRQRQSSLYIMNQQVQKVKKNRLIDRQLFNKESDDNILKSQQSRKEQNLFQNSKIRAQSLYEKKQSSIQIEKQDNIYRESKSFHQKEISSNNRNQSFQNNFYQKGCFSSQQSQNQNVLQEIQNDKTDCKNSKENKSDFNKQHLLNMLKIKIDNKDNDESNPLIIKQYNLPANTVNSNKLIKSHSTDKKRESENLIQKKLDQLHALLSPLSKKSITKVINKVSQKKNKSQLMQEQINMGTSTQDIFKYNSPIILSPIYNVQASTAKNANSNNNNNANKKFFAEDSFTIQSYKSLNSNKEIKSKILKLSEADERVLQISAQLRTASSSQSIENYLEPKIKNHKIASFQKASESIKRFIISPQRTSLENQKNNKKFTFKITNQEEEEEFYQTNKKYVQSLIFPDLKFPVYKNQS
ncbi:cyclic nucleotide-binding domain protein (macronuclear) [Tetrahymena thermophila SB210]|uniref:Cyclic nucleotide-binding domain protein n=1 Tax=Tetrahymena thermophila (strain SB210) TaxID=312017 RepID=Q233S8_TETTS|nr:cyclic nucleotide-binding domain protein [Tetrahymena thermophila SB210]EAR91751.2 cyclic nucleotide-binding domain protein [Tetrahymena thermophila SB210]|eukprot:XP_001011996.2 cyclic nucleotide-binding domain protein [Tetrahymena thermophila SB210]